MSRQRNRPNNRRGLVPLGPRDRSFSLSRSAGNQVSRGAQTVETGNPLLFGPTSAVDDMNIDPTRFAECRRQGMTVASLETTAKKGSIASSRRVPRDLFTTRKAPTKEVQQAQEVPQTAPSRPKYAGCGSRTHTLAWYFQCDDRGMMEGCPRCNTLSHGANNCGFHTNAREVVSDLLYSRANMPPFSGRPWFLVFEDYIKGKESPPIPQAFPWSPAFALEKRAEITKLQAELDAHRDRSKLPVDPSTKDWVTIQTIVVFKKDPESHPLH
ncbi:hypothetical protein BGZ61DRAFT_473048 [Ilyonectria robusta]|uniref:uncharacterized protein n=1 Tax=Ilyonectria robusta TaxID=1079257 RepID=UPI001E8E543D|nr:uncharacterized protein BGZ61DRAFT_473048 [Ilyonectria robusta]KAH8734304.1 hypothetical protein BGZ61DRAFT_473048 [Ilyonectria robusta]